MMIHKNLTAETPPSAKPRQSAERRSTASAARPDPDTAPLTAAERAVWNDPELLAGIEAVLDDPSLAVPLEDLG